MSGLAMRVRRCANCNDDLDAYSNEIYCGKECMLEAMYEQEMTCKACNGDGQGVETAKGEWDICRRCQGTGYTIKVKS